jgi:hypothetical protein
MQREVGPLGGQLASIESTQACEALLQLPSKAEEATEKPLVDTAHAAFVTAGGVTTMLRVAGRSGPPVSTGSATACILMAFKSHGRLLQEAFISSGGPATMVRVMRNTYVTLPHRAAAAGVIWFYLVPDNQAPDPSHLRGKASPAVQRKGKTVEAFAPVATASLASMEMVRCSVQALVTRLYLLQNYTGAEAKAVETGV